MGIHGDAEEGQPVQYVVRHDIDAEILSEFPETAYRIGEALAPRIAEALKVVADGPLGWAPTYRIEVTISPIGLATPRPRRLKVDADSVK